MVNGKYLFIFCFIEADSMVNLSDELLQTRAALANLTFELVGSGTCLTSLICLMFSSDMSNVLQWYV